MMGWNVLRALACWFVIGVWGWGRVPTASAQAAGTGAWQADVGTKLAVSDAQLVLTAPEVGPTIVARGLMASSEPLTLEMRLKAAASGPGRVSWSDESDGAFEAGRSASFAIEHDDAWHDTRVALPMGPRSIRIAVGTGRGVARFARLRLVSATGGIVREWRYTDAPVPEQPSGPKPTIDAGPVAGVVIDYSPASSKLYIGSPSLAVLPNGDYVASHDFFSTGNTGDRTRVFGSSDRGGTWALRAELKGQWWSSLFVHEGALYIMGPTSAYGACVIRRSVDGGRSWTTPKDEDTGLLFDDSGRFHCAPVPTIVHAGRLWRGMEDSHGPGGWGSHFRAFVMSAPVGADLLRSSSWTISQPIARDPHWLDGGFGGWLEGNAVVTKDGEVVNLLRVDVPAGTAEKAALIRISADGRRALFDPATGFLDFPGGSKKFVVRYDPKSALYWALSNVVSRPDATRKPSGIRNALALLSSPDLRTWVERTIVLNHPDVARHGFQYPDFQFDGEDIIAVVRTAYDDPHGGARNNHDANYLTFHRIAGFRAFAQRDP